MGQSLERKIDELLPLTAVEMKELERMGKVHRFEKGGFIWDEGDAADSVWLMKSGRANLEILSSEGNASLVHFCTKAQTFCPAAAISGNAYPCAAVAAEPVEAVAIPRASFMKFFDRLPSFARNFIDRKSVV